MDDLSRTYPLVNVTVEDKSFTGELIETKPDGTLIVGVFDSDLKLDLPKGSRANTLGVLAKMLEKLGIYTFLVTDDQVVRTTQTLTRNLGESVGSTPQLV